MLDKPLKIITLGIVGATFIFSNILKAESIMDIVNLVFQNNYEYKAAIEKYNVQYAYKGLATGYLLPKIDLAASTAINKSQREYDDNVIDESGHTVRPYGFDITLTQPLFDVQAWGYFNQSRLMAEQAEINLDRDKNQIILKTIQYYLDVLLAKEDVEFIRVQKEYLEQQLKVIEKKVSVGGAKSVDVDTVKAQYAKVVATEIAYINAEKVKIDQIDSLGDKKINSYKKIKAKIDNVIVDQSTLKEWQDLTLKSNLDILNSQIALRITGSEITKSNATYYPRLVLIGKYTYNHSQDVANNKAGYVDTGKYVGLSLTMNIFAGGSDYQQGKQVRAAQRQSEYESKALEQNIQTLTTEYYLNVYNGLSQIEALEQAMLSAKKSLKAIERSYEVGINTVTDVLEGNQKYVEAERNLTQAKYNFLLSILSLKAISGVLQNEDVINIDGYLE